MTEFASVIRSQAPDLALAFFVLFIVLVLASTLMYYAKDAQPEVFSGIPASMWWGVVTITTIGYGDTVLVTTEDGALSRLAIPMHLR